MREQPRVRKWVGSRTRRSAAWVLFISLFVWLLILTVLTGIRLWHVPVWYLSAASDRNVAINEYRRSVGPIFVGMLQALGGGAILYGLWMNSRQYAFTQVQYLAQRLKDATTQLESDHAPTRYSAIHELEGIARANDEHRARIVETLRLHVRNRAAPSSDPPLRGRRLPDDVLTAIAVVTRLDVEEHRSSARFNLDLRGADLSRVELGDWINDARLDGANLSRKVFSGYMRIAAPGAVFHDAIFRGVTWFPNHGGGGLAGADFTGARFETSVLTSSSLDPVNLRGAVLDRVVFDHGAVSRCDLNDASIRNSKFENVTVFEYNLLAGASLDGTTLQGSHVHPWQLAEFEKARTQPADYGDMTERWQGPGGPFNPAG